MKEWLVKSNDLLCGNLIEDLIEESFIYNYDQIISRDGKGPFLFQTLFNIYDLLFSIEEK